MHVLLALSLSANLWFLLQCGSGEEAPAGAEAGGLTAATRAVLEQPLPSPDEPGEATTPAVEENLDREAHLAVEAAEPAGDLDIPARFIRVEIDGPVSRGFVKKLGSPLGDRLALTASRLIVWSMDLSRDPRPGDVVDGLYNVAEDEQLTVLALRYESKKFSRSFSSWRHQPAGWSFPSWFDSTGREVPGSLSNAPIRDYEEITALLGDGRGHSGMDFKAPVGTAVYAPFDAVVTRANWRWKYNGNCLEIRSDKGTTARFLHLSKLASGVKSGDRIERGQLVARSGNTGRSSAPHLHYELSGGSGTEIDPLEFHTVEHRSLDLKQRRRFETRRAELAGWFEQALAHGGG